MNTKLTLRMDTTLVEAAKSEASRRGKSVSQMVGDFFDTLMNRHDPKAEIPPVTSSLLGKLKGMNVSESSYKRHLREKYL